MESKGLNSEGLAEHIGLVGGEVFGKPVTLSVDVANRLACVSLQGDPDALLKLAGHQAVRLSDLLNEAGPICDGGWPTFERACP